MGKKMEVSNFNKNVLKKAPKDGQIYGLKNGKWVVITNAPISGSDSHFTLEFNNLTEVIFNHNLNKKPNICVIDNNSRENVVEVEYLNSNTCKIKMNKVFSGTIICN